MNTLALTLALIPFLALSSSRVVDALRRPAGWWAGLRGLQDRGLHGFVYIACLLIPFVLADAPRVAGRPGWLLQDVAGMALYLFLPAAAQWFRRPDAARLDFFDLATLIALWLPIEFGWLPDVQALGFPLARLLAVVNGLLIFLVIAPFEPRPDGTGTLGYTFRLSGRDLRTALVGLAAYMIVGLPIGLATKFLAFGPISVDPGRWAILLVGGYLFVALPEELLFRGLIQNLLERRFPQWPELTIGLAAVIFGLTHLNNPTVGFPMPNWTYALMATLAGLAYGWVWRRTGKITASAATHALVNLIWGIVLSGRL